jgi:hypothetical protein
VHHSLVCDYAAGIIAVYELVLSGVVCALGLCFVCGLAALKDDAARVKRGMESAANRLKESFIPSSHTGKRGTLKFLRLLLQRYPRLHIVKALEDAIMSSDSGLARSDAQVRCLCF